MAGTWLEELLANLQSGGQPPMMAPPASPFPDAPRPPDEAALAEAAREAAGQRMIRANRRRIDPFGMPDMNSAGVQLALEQSPAGTGFPGATPAGAPDSSPFGMVPPSLAMAKSLTANAPKAEPEPLPPGAIPPGEVPMPRPRPVSTDMSSVNREAPPAPMAPAGPAPAPMSIAAPPPAEPSFMSRLNSGAQSMAPALLAAGAALQGDNSVAASMLKQREALAMQAEQQNMTAQALLARGAPVAEVRAAVRNPDLLKAMIGKYFETGKPLVVGGHVVREKPGGGLEVLGDFSKDEKAPAGFEKRADGTLHFIKGGPADPDYLREKGEKNAAPSGYRWVDPKNPDAGLVAIPGGPGEKVTPEVSARLGLAKSFLGQLPDIRRDIEKGDATGPWDAMQAKAGVGRAGELNRQIKSGAEALLRNLTGAGMSQSEAQNYVSRYELQPWDTTKTVRSKLDQLERELQYTITEVEKGRSPIPQARPAAPSGGRAGTVDVGGQKIQWSVN
jgi:hypothetical protein